MDEFELRTVECCANCIHCEPDDEIAVWGICDYHKTGVEVDNICDDYE